MATVLSVPGMGKGRDGTVPRKFSRSRSSRRLLSRSRSHGTQKAPGQIGTRVALSPGPGPDHGVLRDGTGIPTLSRDNRPSLICTDIDECMSVVIF